MRFVDRLWRRSGKDRPRALSGGKPWLECLEDRNCPAPFSVIGATGSPTTILSVKVFDDQGNLAASVQPFNNLTSIRVAVGDFDGDGIDDEVAVLGRRTNTDLAAEIVTYDMNTQTGALTEVSRFDAFAPGILGNGFITTGDFDGDGDDDIAVAQIGGGAAQVTLQTHLSNGDGTFTAGGSAQINFGVISAPRIAAGDTDNDGFDEIVVAARTPQGAGVRVFDADTGTPTQQGGFVWDFGVTGYNRGAFVAVGEFDATFDGEEIVLGSNVGGGGRVDVVSFDGTNASLVTNGRFQPFGASYNAAIRVSVGTQILDMQGGGPVAVDVILSGQDRFQSGQAVFARRGFDIDQTTQDPSPAFIIDTPFTVLAGADGQAPGGGLLGPFVAQANTTVVQAPGGIEAFTQNNLNTPTGNGNVVPGGTIASFAIDNSQLAVPAGAAFGDPNNSLFVNVDLQAEAIDVLDEVDLTLRFFTGATTPFAFAVIFRVGDNPPSVAASRITAQFTDGAAQTVDATTPDSAGRIFGFLIPLGTIGNFFSPPIDLGTAGTFWVLEVDNGSTENVSLLDWELIFDFA